MGHKDRTHASQGIVQVQVWLQHSSIAKQKNVQSIAGHIPVITLATKLVRKCLWYHKLLICNWFGYQVHYTIVALQLAAKHRLT